MYLSKSDFKIARTCPTKLYYKKSRYPSMLDENPYLGFLADGGYMVEKMAKLVFPDGIEVGFWNDPVAAFDETRRLIATGDVTLFEPTVIHANLMARIDILIREGNVLKLIEVKSSSVESGDPERATPFRGARGRISSKWVPYLEDVTFQAHVLGAAFPELDVKPFLCVVDKEKIATSNLTFDRFQLRRPEPSGRRFSVPEVDYLGDAESIRSSHLMAFIDVGSEVAELLPEVVDAAQSFAATLRDDVVERQQPELGQKCKKCEYRMRTGGGDRNGFRECWGGLAAPDPHVLDLYRIDRAGGNSVDLAAELATTGKASLADVPEERLTGAVRVRQLRQLECLRTGKEWIDPLLAKILARHERPLHFIDFEASRLAIPYHAGMHPYELAAFQWSCHTLGPDQSATRHGEWLDDTEAFPNFAFARSLRDRIGSEGTVYTWSPYEVSTLKEVRRQMEKYGEGDAELMEWLDEMIEPGNRRIVDLCALAKDHYLHPDMKGSFSIKDVLPAVWRSNAALRDMPEFREYARLDEVGNVLDPYDTLEPLPIGTKEEVIKEGTGAMRAYQEMMFGLSAGDPGGKASLRKLLLQYCKLDTAAMVIIWRHWIEGGASRP
jgi:hypothetical protein